MASRKPRAQDVDRFVGLRLRQARVLLNLSQAQLADLIGVTYQQVHKYETGVNRIACGMLYRACQALDCEPNFFFKGIKDVPGIGGPGVEMPDPPRLRVQMARAFAELPPQTQRGIASLVRALAKAEAEENV